jgi:hypothetical protein
MFIRGSGSGAEAGRDDTSFYRGIVVKNNDPLRLNRVKIYIPEISNQPLDNWFADNDELDIRFPGINNTGDAWQDTKIFEEIASRLSWAEPAFPIFGESGAGRYYKDDEICTITDANYQQTFEINNKEPISISTGTFAPAFLYENDSTVLGDAFNAPLKNFTSKCNPYSFAFKPTKHVNKSKGVFGIPEVGSNVWVFFDNGDSSYPVYFAVSHDLRELTLINDTDNSGQLSPSYPSIFEN